MSEHLKKRHHAFDILMNGRLVHQVSVRAADEAEGRALALERAEEALGIAAGDLAAEFQGVQRKWDW